ncbi:hypothetical protein CONLIGDRAFT_455863 [Coniochaeta ligniaria NRRL 30616]|uniref:Uncharacterized protein n=1 Tax=Coniochaeta ligniaria NRRL 30616 TaxID=1408157 RepID=A0A1J7IK60_9PEZI|nr:hypothetical protein CONLIGDRAFT_455863 [Coniochaeta ligniaria NRRL 30616]
MSDSSSDDRSHHGGAKLVPQPRRQPSGLQAPPAPSKDSSHKKLQVAQVNDTDSPTPLPKGQRTAERAAAQPAPFHHRAPIQIPPTMQIPNMGYPALPKPSFGIPSESSASSGYYHIPMPRDYGTYISPHGGHHLVLASQSSNTTSSVDAMTTGIGGIKLKEYQQEANKYIRHAQEQIFNLLQKTYQQEGLPPQFQQGLDRALKNLTQDLGNLQGFVDRVASEADHAKNKDNESQTFQATAGMQAVQIERLRSRNEELRMSLTRAEKNNEEVQQSYQHVLVSLKEQNERSQQQLKQYQEQLEGKRHLFYTAHDDVEGKARILSIVSDNDYAEKAKIIQSLIDSAPQDKAKILEILFSNNAQAPAHNRSVSYQPTMMAIQSGSATPAADFAWSGRGPSRVTPPAPTMRRTPSAFHSGSIMRPQSTHPIPNATRFSHPRSRPSTGRPGSGRVDAGAARYRFDDIAEPTATGQEFGSPQLSRARQMVIRQNEAELINAIEVWKEEFSKIFRLVNGWAAQYAVQVQPDQALTIQKEAPRLWEFMCDILYPGQPEAGASHARFLLEDEQCRSFFVERMMLQYIVNNVLSVEGWMGFNDDTDRELKELNDRLQSTEVFKSYIRQSIIDQISSTIGRMLADPSFNEYRARRISFHQQRLKTIVGPLMDPEASRTDAGFDLHAVASTALQVSALMFQSRLNFEFSWSLTCSKFSLDYHVPKEPPCDPLMLQAKQYRIKLVVTPAILFRDDRGVSINPKRVLRSEVFVMN